MSRVILKSREDIEIYREGDRVFHIPFTDKGKEEIANALRFYRAFDGWSVTPKLLLDDPLCTQYIQQEAVTNEHTFYRSVAHIVWSLREREVRHGDATSANILVQNNCAYLIDWQEAAFIGEGKEPKRPEPDAHHLWHAAVGLSPDTTRRARRWTAIRERLGNVVTWGTLIDAGCHQGDFCFYATAEGMTTFGVDRQFSSLDMESFWPTGLPFFYQREELPYYHLPESRVQAVLLLSVFPYLVQDYGWKLATETCERYLHSSKVLFFETQLYGDGPGPKLFQTDDDVYAYLSALAKVEKVVTIEVAGRSQSRTVWEMRER